ncbi:MAG: hypothetical protein JO316_15670 [Abitibacteriaceae bacterium]|nr:hypothetical protein [Abditibacteriaceae bacterium]MBV9866793.1 hypothetical protein [Abditibacteriaceae bacterium]
MKNKNHNNLDSRTEQATFIGEEHCHVEVSARDWQHIIQVAESNEINPALARAAMRYATPSK